MPISDNEDKMPVGQRYFHPDFELQAHQKPGFFAIPEFFVIKFIFCGIWTRKRNY